MTKKSALLSAFAFISLLLVSACSTISGSEDVAAYNANPLSMPIPADVSGDTLETAMTTTFEGRGWTVTSSSPTEVVGQLNHRGFEAQATMKREGNVVKIYSNSTQANPKTGAEEAAVPLGWLENLQKDFPRRLAAASR